MGYVCLSGVRPFGVSLLIAGWDVDENVPYLYQCDPSVCGFFFSRCTCLFKFALLTEPNHLRVPILPGKPQPLVKIMLTEKHFWKKGPSIFFLFLFRLPKI
jgi:hypothetical protein